jgi:hypothetical protein
LEDCRKKVEWGTPFKPSFFTHTSEYATLKKYLSPELIKDLEVNSEKNVQWSVDNPRLTGDNYYKSKLLDEITELESKWGLI